MSNRQQWKCFTSIYYSNKPYLYFCNFWYISIILWLHFPLDFHGLMKGQSILSFCLAFKFYLKRTVLSHLFFIPVFLSAFLDTKVFVIQIELWITGFPRTIIVQYIYIQEKDHKMKQAHINLFADIVPFVFHTCGNIARLFMAIIVIFFSTIKFNVYTSVLESTWN